MEQQFDDYDYFFINDHDELSPALPDDVLNTLYERDSQQAELPEKINRPLLRSRYHKPESRILPIHPGCFRLSHTSAIKSAMQQSQLSPCSFVVLPITDYDVIRSDKKGFETGSNCIIVTPDADLPEPVRLFFHVTDQILRSPFPTQ